MKALLYTIMIFGCLSLGSVCCKDVCFGGNPVFSLRVASKINSTNLLFGANKQYVFNKNMFFNKALTDSFFFRNIKFNCYILPDQTKDSVLDISLSIEANKIYFQLPNNSLDSFEFTFKDYDPNSCDAYFSIEQVKFNQNLIQPDNRNYYYTIYK